MPDPLVQIASDGPVTTLTLSNPDRLNALSPAMLDALREGMAEAVANGARALVLTGEGRAFSSGADLQGDGTAFPDDLGALLDAHYNPLARAMAELPVPLVSAVNGPAVGAGMGFALSGDIVVAARSAYFMLAFANIGLVPDAGASWVVARSVGRARAMELALLGEQLSAEDALAMGLVTRVVDDEAVLAEAQALAARLAAGPTLALGLIRKQMAAALDTGFSDMLDVERANQTKAGRSEDFREAVVAFAAKRKPDFKGR
ncbi:enoyl-CoA hydratase-related protein [Alteraurantiacibacter aquimixticola]|uniref:2-(1,2-epoxy-1,2-dihydrophenyl)acetyl-CoA isomerase n=1 Tax=Alteraurantiacibacter aquimixticola TaxID=2489173 RepID=A0A4T3F3U3_9SPHN|nr:enoyl-CoA hydratase-related protein [Alteraurantiacibacter aquimixticola]TIX50954.1 2-(1,2-epoxy-1,2-dihydrophenyl)acetyl-CoA isomerase [Alteraurantiacibacter aquimixticola]